MIIGAEKWSTLFGKARSESHAGASVSCRYVFQCRRQQAPGQSKTQRRRAAAEARSDLLLPRPASDPADSFESGGINTEGIQLVFRRIIRRASERPRQATASCSKRSAHSGAWTASVGYPVGRPAIAIPHWDFQWTRGRSSPLLARRFRRANAVQRTPRQMRAPRTRACVKSSDRNMTCALGVRAL